MKVSQAFFATTSLCSGLLLAMLAAPAVAADQAPPSEQPAPAAQPGPGASPPATSPSAANNGSDLGELVVTGSRIKTTTYTSPAPMTVLTGEQAELIGAVDTSQIMQLIIARETLKEKAS